MKTCLFDGARASIKFAIGDTVAVVVGGRSEDLAAGGKAVIVCDVELIEEVVLLLVLAIVPSSMATVARLSSRKILFSTIRFNRRFHRYVQGTYRSSRDIRDASTR
jgi:hypothetical protein